MSLTRVYQREIKEKKKQNEGNIQTEKKNKQKSNKKNVIRLIYSLIYYY